MGSDTAEQLRAWSDDLDSLAQSLRINSKTREQWNAVLNVESAARYLFSAAAWLERGELGDDEEGEGEG